MSVILLRKLTTKSIIGFGNYKDLRVQDLINLKRHKELLQIYYNLGNIDFTEEVKEYCCITRDRQITKPGKDNTAYRFFLGEILYDIIERDKTYRNSENSYGLNLEVKHLNKATKNAQIRANCIRQNKEKSKINNRNRNQGKR